LLPGGRTQITPSLLLNSQMSALDLRL
jgi:hypothetical protein